MPDEQDVREPFFEDMLKRWPDREAAERYLREAHARDLEAAAQPPVVNVTLAGVPGHFTGTAGQGDAAYVPETLA